LVETPDQGSTFQQDNFQVVGHRRNRVRAVWKGVGAVIRTSASREADPAVRVAMRRIVVWRHGGTAWNKERRFQGASDQPLDETGVAQVEAAARDLERLGPVALVTSDATRARQTAAPLASRCQLSPVLDPRLREADLGGWEGLTRVQVAERFPQEYASWRQGVDVRRGGGETDVEVAKRAEAALADALIALQPGQTLVAVTHGGTARVAIGRRLGLDSSSWRCLGTLGHGRWAMLKEMSFGWQLAEHNVRPRRR
jgi:glucosyl-3-phosphoglycerate phosphatase